MLNTVIFMIWLTNTDTADESSMNDDISHSMLTNISFFEDKQIIVINDFLTNWAYI